MYHRIQRRYNQIKSKNNLIFNTNAYKQKNKIVATLTCMYKRNHKDMIDAGVNVLE
jgi:hypothetical protein